MEEITWENLERHKGAIVFGLKKAGVPARELRDYTSDVMLRLYKSRHTYNPSRGKLTTFIVTVAHNYARTQGLREGCKQRYMAWAKSEYKRGYDDPVVSDPVDTSKLSEELYLLARGISYKHLALLTGKKLNTLKSHVNRDRKKIHVPK